MAKEMKSKLSYYIIIELELYPGTNITTLQKYSAKCQSSFEKIREAWADVFEYQYKPLIMYNAYPYQINYQLNEEREREIEKERHNVIIHYIHSYLLIYM